MDTFLENILTVINEKNTLKRTTMLVAALLLSAIVYNVLLLPTNLVSGGVNGIGIITEYLYGIDPYITILFILTICAFLSFTFLGVERTFGTLVSCAIYPLFVKITSPLGSLVVVDTNDMFLITIFAGVLLGLSNGIIYKTGYSNGGFQIVSQILYKYFNISIAKTTMVINTIIVVTGGYIFGFTMVMYAIILLYISSIVIDKVLLGISNNKAFYIITTEDKKVKDYIINALHHSVTTFAVKGGFLEKRSNVLLAVVPSREYFKVTEGIKLIDKDAFFVVTDAYQVEGGK